jgi:hypothetical protein
MYQASNPNSSTKVQTWISTFDFVGFLLFFHAIFTVIHALSIIIWSMLTSQEYHRYHSIPISTISLDIEKIKESPFYSFLYKLNYYPFLTCRQKAEFKVIHILFRNTFGVPLNFNYGEYLGKCFERYSLNIIKLSVTSWIVMFLLYGLNLIRILSPTPKQFDCNPHETQVHETEVHESEENDRGGGGGGGALADTSLWNIRILSEDDETFTGASGCDLSYVRMFTLCSVMLECYVIVVFFIGRVYTLRLLKKAGVNEITRDEDDLSYFLDEEAAQEHIALQKQAKLSSVNENAPLAPTRGRRMSIKTFSKFIRQSLSPPHSIS